ncbi:hypothetical protein V497_05905 [Pseudogymnoascus sp. VKM F-4516 (FW-969)]|nr:hypothetical protein V497_05905 [Pseudogymnoascus sp. VKM F-4516 (FW-969)]
MDLIRAHPHLRTEPIAHPIRHPRRRIPKHARGVNARHEALSQLGGGRQDRVGVVRAVRVDVHDRRLGVGDGLDSEFEGEVLGVVVYGVRSLDQFVAGELLVQHGFGLCVAAQDDVLCEQRLSDLREQRERGGLNEQDLGAVAGGGVGGLGVDDDACCCLLVGGVFEVEGADSVSVAEDGDLSRRLDEADEIVGAARDDEVDVLVQREELGDHVAGFDELDGVVGDLGCGEGGGDDGGDGDEGFGGFFAAWGDGVSIVGVGGCRGTNL